MLTRFAFRSRWAAWAFIAVLVAVGPLAGTPWLKSAHAQGDKKSNATAADKKESDKSESEKKLDAAAERTKAALNSPSEETPEKKAPAKEPTSTAGTVIELFQKGGPLMYPIVGLSIIALGYTIERMLALRRERVIPRKLVQGLNDLMETPGNFDYRQAYQLCQKYPSSTATVVRSMLDKTGRDTTEIEQALQNACDREASRLYENVRPIAIAFAVAPLFGLMGTVLGMIQLFYAWATQVNVVGNAALAEGIYTKLVTTFSGLCVAIPAVIASQLLEGKIRRLFYAVGDLGHRLVRPLEAYEGKQRPTPEQLAEPPAPPVRNVPVATLAKAGKN